MKIMKEETTPISLAEAVNKGFEQGREFSVKRQNRTKIVCNRIKNLRLSKDITQSELCDAIEVNRITYSGYENCRAEPPMEVLVRIADYYHVSLDYIAGRTKSMDGMKAPNIPVDPEKQRQMQEIEEMQKQLEELKKRIHNTN